MTRINAGIDPKELKRAHLIAEWREITMVPASLKRSLRTKTKSDVLQGIPKEFSLNKNHVKFFYNKQKYLRKRMMRIASEMQYRGYVPDLTRLKAFEVIDSDFENDWQETTSARQIVLERINERINQKPHLYKD